MVGIPVFPSRVFRHSAIYVRKDKAVKTPKDLEGLTLGIPEWAQTAGIYVRGFLSEFYGVDLTKIRWVQAGVNEPGRQEKVSVQLPAGISVESRPHDSLSAMLASGAIDGAITARAPACFLAHDPHVERLWSDFQSEEARFYAATGVFPIMHVVTLRRAVFEAHPWVAMNLLTAFEEAKDASLARLLDITASRVPLPWATAHAQRAQASMGQDLWPYGLEPNRKTLEAFCRYAFNQGLASRLLAVEDLFPKETHARIRV
jgi:4,5-dihydroxyphthalate decarboxylase